MKKEDEALDLITNSTKKKIDKDILMVKLDLTKTELNKMLRRKRVKAAIKTNNITFKRFSSELKNKEHKQHKTHKKHKLSLKKKRKYTIQKKYIILSILLVIFGILLVIEYLTYGYKR